MKSVMTPSQYFTHVASPEIQRSKFDRSSGYKTTFNAGQLIPVFVDEALPGDTYNVSATMFGRLSTPLKPIMDNMFIDIHWFSVPMRLVWSNWKKFNGEQANPADSTNFTIPTCTATAGTGYGEMSIFDYMGLPTKIPGFTHSALFNRAYNLIWNEWYRDENLQDSAYCPTGDGPDTVANYDVRPRGKRKDYFTSALPWAQKASPVSIPLGTSAPVIMNPSWDNTTQNGQQFHYKSNKNLYNSNDPLQVRGATGSSQFADGTAFNILYLDPNNTWVADLSTATAATINSLRQAFQIQKMYERDARGGTRYTEVIRAHFGVISPDARLQRPEYLGGGTSPINFNPIAQTQGTGASGTTTPQGNLAAMATLTNHQNGFNKSFTEHEIIIGLASVRADLNYQQGLNRMWSRSTRFDFYWPALAHLGEQAILNKEIYCQGTANPTQDAATFGYQERYAEYRYKPSLITGQFRSNSTTPLDYWHLAQKFTSLPALNDTFVRENPPISRIVAVPSEPNFLLDCYFKCITARPMPTFATPGLIDHF